MNSYKKGFTLIELLVVIAIIGVLSSIVMSQLNSARKSASDAAAKAAFRNLAGAALLYYENQGSYGGRCNDTNPTTHFQDIYSGMTNLCYNAALGYKVKVQLKVQNQFNSTSGVDWLCTDTSGNVKILDNDPGVGATIPC